MSKSYYQNDKVIIPFSKVDNVYSPNSPKGEYIKVFVTDKSYEMENSSKEDFLSQYTAWLDLQSTPSL